VDAILLAGCSAGLFGAMTVALRFALAHGAGAEAGAFLTIVPAFGVALAFALVRSGWDLDGVWPFLLAGVLGPGCSQILFTLGIRDAGPSRASATVGTAPLFSVAIALVLLDEPLIAGAVVGALLIVAGGAVLMSERVRPERFKPIGLVFALAATMAFASRDNLVRWLSVDTDVDPALAATATMMAGGATILGFLLVSRRPLGLRSIRAYVPAGILFGLSYVCLFEAYYRGRVTVVSPIVATESLWGVTLSAVFLRRHELVGPRLVAGAALVVAGGVLIGVFR